MLLRVDTTSEELKEEFVSCHRKGKVYSGTYLSGANAIQSSIANLESPVTKCFIPIKFTS